MSGPVSPPLATTESGTTTIVRPTNTLEFNGADFTVTGSGSKATISIDSTGTGAALTATQVGFGDSSNLLTGSTKFTYNDTAGSEQLKLIGTGVSDCGILLENTNTGSTSAPDLVLFRSVTGADNDFIGRMDYRGKNASGSDVTYVMVSGKINDASEDAGRIGWFVSGNASLNADDAQLMIFGRTSLSGNPGLVSINNSARSDVDFRVSGNTVASLIRTDASQDNVGIGGSPDSSVETLHIQGVGQTNPMVMIESSDSPGVTDGNPSLRLYNSSSGGTNLQIGKLEFAGKNASSAEVQYFEIETLIADTTAGSEDGRVDFNVKMGGANQTYLRLGTTSQQVQINAAGTNIDTIIKSETQNFVFVSALSSNTHMAVGFNGEGTSQSGGGAQFQVDEDASFLLPVAGYTANHDITAVQAHGYALQMKTGSGTGTFTLPETAEIGMHVTVINFGSGMNVAVSGSSSHKINGGGSAGNSTTATVTAAGARYDCVYIATDVWNVTAPAVVTAS